MRYYLMNKDERLVCFHTEPSLGGSTRVIEDERIGTILPIGYTDAATWVDNRNYAKHRDHLKAWLREWGINTVDGFLQITHCLGLNDTFWVKPADSELSWDRVSLYTNEFTDVACKTAFESGLAGLQLSSTSPEFTMDGSFPKCWIRDDEGIHVLKRGLMGASNVGLEPYCEFISASIGRKLFSRVVPYDLVVYKGRLCSKCDLFTTEQTGYVQFSKTIDTSRNYTIDDVLNYFSNYDAKHGTEFELAFREMTILDCI